MTYARIILATPDASTLVRVRADVVLDELRDLAALLGPGVSVRITDDERGRDLAVWRK